MLFRSEPLADLEALLQWEVKTDNCSSASKSANGSNADPCGSVLPRVAPGGIQTPVDEKQEWGVRLFPNPAHSGFWLESWNVDAPLQVEIYSIQGQLLSAREYNSVGQEQLYIDVSAFPAGLLLVSVSSGGERRMAKLRKI